MAADAITAIAGIEVGHYTDTEAITGCTVVLCESGAVGGVDVRGSAPGTRETDLLRPTNSVAEVNAVLLSGGSAFGLDAASGVMRYLEERGAGHKAGPFTVPIVPAAILFDLGLGDHTVRPGPEEGYQACREAASGPFAEGSVGAGTGATVGKLMGWGRDVKGGIGTAAVDLGDGLVVGAIVAVNAMGSIFDPDTGALVAGPRHEDETGMSDSLAAMTSPGYVSPFPPSPTNTTIGVVATNAPLSKEQANKLASVAHDGVALAVRPAHLMHDGDAIFALATGGLDRPADFDRICAASVLSVGRAIASGVRKATGLGGVPSVMELAPEGGGRV